MSKFVSWLLSVALGCLLSNSILAAGLLPNGYPAAGLPKPLPYTYNGVVYIHAIAAPHTEANDHWIAYYNGDLTWDGTELILPPDSPCFYQISPNGPISGDPNALCGSIGLNYNHCTKTYYSDTNIRANGDGVLHGDGVSCEDISYSAGDLLIKKKSYAATTSLKWPLTGKFKDRTISLDFGDTWTFGECPIGTYKKHGGTDVSATAGEPVYAAHDGIVKKIHDATADGWAYAIVIEDSSGLFTTVYWHVSPYGTLAKNDPVTRGQQIATIANLGAGTHFHFGIRNSSYDAKVSLTGSLPIADGCNYPAFPENLLDPADMLYQAIIN